MELMKCFKEDTLQVIVGQALPHVSHGCQDGVKRDECVTVVLFWFRTGGNVKTTASKTKSGYQVCLRAIFEGITGLAACFEPFRAYGPVSHIRSFSVGKRKTQP